MCNYNNNNKFVSLQFVNGKNNNRRERYTDLTPLAIYRSNGAVLSPSARTLRFA